MYAIDNKKITSDIFFEDLSDDLADNFLEKTSYSSKRPSPSTKWVYTKKDTKRPLEKNILKVKRSRKPLPYDRKKEYKIYKLDIII